ncbi:SMP-30/gluconolactonase/LRE family protein [Conexibacter woesei]|uniref:SMP-30/Gluconolaconase/LRE domain protein n=1 Tax=Conexibacter woesei (strain DSM 14684 / CCUG 47730 / CIP 108061 / JCM 11494 / NBRC 100937 / ID131577) TaxID=469383 RepID=D3FB06_CONWI|nr:SMP-30/gluconolactonase/LRE family protein [Conexibacter woesei]ADB53198.1 SMP-30/Gluconolaconase/LRE domain protein [Conexibacter woesei DSM 14684]
MSAAETGARTSGAPLFEASVFVDGIVGPVRLSHPECVAFDADGNAWCGGERGEIYRVAADGSAIEQVASTGGFVLGVALDGRGFLYACDLAERAVFRVDVASGAVERFADGGGAMATPNFAVVDERRGCLYVSDSREAGVAGPSIWRVALAGGACEPWHPGGLTFANGLALSADGDSLYVAETWARQVVRIAIGRDGAPVGEPEVVVETSGALPDGLALDAAGRLYIACYEPSRVYRFDPAGGAGGASGAAGAGGASGAGLELLLDDPTAHTLCHPTNCAFRGSELFIANLGRWHLARAEVGAEGLPLPGQR